MSWSPASGAGGRRRSRAWRAIPALVRQREDAEALELALIENMAREDLNPIEEARACAALVEELGLTREEVGRRVGRSRVAVSNLMRLLDLPDEVIELLQAGRAERGPRQGAAAGRGPRRAPRASRAPAVAAGMVGEDRRSARPAEQRGDGARAAKSTAGAAPQRAPRPGAGGARRSRRRSAGRSARRCG